MIRRNLTPQSCSSWSRPRVTKGKGTFPYVKISSLRGGFLNDFSFHKIGSFFGPMTSANTHKVQLDSGIVGQLRQLGYHDKREKQIGD